jgi:O-antigen/teichoic acid export membrane protein
VFSLVSVVMALNVVILKMAFDVGIFRYYHHCEGEWDQKTLISTTFYTVLFVGTVLTIIQVSACKQFSWFLFGNVSYQMHLRLAFAASYLLMLSLIPLSILRLKEASKHYSILAVAKFVLDACLNIYFIVFLGRGVLGLFEAGLLSSIIIFLLVLPIILKNCTLSFSLVECKKLFKYCIPLLLAAIAARSLHSVDRYFLSYFADTHQVGLYSLGYKIGMLLSVFLYSPFLLIWPAILFPVAKEDYAKEFYSRLFTYLMLTAVMMTVAISIFSIDILRLLSPPQFWDADQVVLLICLTYVAYLAYKPLSVCIDIKDQTRYHTYIKSGAALLNLVLDYFLIKTYGMMGAAVATLICFVLMSVFAFLFASKYYKINYEWNRVFKIFMVGAFVLVVNQYISPSNIIISLTFKLFLLLLYPFLLYLINTFTSKELVKAKEYLAVFRLKFRERFLSHSISK